MVDIFRFSRALIYIIGVSVIIIPDAKARSLVNGSAIASYSKVTENKEYLFVMLWAGPSTNKSRLEKKLHKRSGLYRNDGSSTPLWTVDWYARKYESQGVIPLSDGIHLVRFKREYHIKQQIAFVLYKKGNAFLSFRLKDLKPNNYTGNPTTMEYSSPGKVNYNKNNGVISVKLENGVKYDVSISAGISNSIDKFNYPKQCGFFNNPLQHYQLNKLKMVETKLLKNQRWVIVKTPDGISHQTKEGECIGNNYGAIKQITETETVVHEIVPDGLGGWIRTKSILRIND